MIAEGNLTQGGAGAGLPNPSPNLTQVDSSFHRTPDFENEKAEDTRGLEIKSSCIEIPIYLTFVYMILDPKA